MRNENDIAHRKFIKDRNHIRKYVGKYFSGSTLGWLQLGRIIAEQHSWANPQTLTKVGARALVMRYWTEVLKLEPLVKTPKVKAPKIARAPKLEAIPLKSDKPKTNDDAFFSCREWRELRYKAFKLHGNACQCCGATAASSGKPLHCDHVKPRHTHPQLEWEITNLQILCEECNMGKGAWDSTDWRIPTETPVSAGSADLDAAFRRRMN